MSYEGHMYYDATRAALYFGISRKTFYKSFKPFLNEYTLPTHSENRKFYREDELARLKGLR